MKTVKLSVFVIGVAFSVAPIFNSAFAQSGSNSTAVFLELQALRVEIGELRDMVERQQFELKKLKQTLAKEKAAAIQPYAQNAPQGVYTRATDVAVSEGYSAQPYSQPNPQLAQLPDGQSRGAEFGSVTQPPQQPNTGVASNGSAARVDSTDPYLSQNRSLEQTTQRPGYQTSSDTAQQGWVQQGRVMTGSAPINSGGLDDRVVEPNRGGGSIPVDTDANEIADVEVVERGIEGYSGTDRAPVLSPGQVLQTGQVRTMQNTPSGDGLPTVGGLNQDQVNQSGNLGQPQIRQNQPILSIPNSLPTQQTAINANQRPVSPNPQADVDIGQVNQATQARVNTPQFSEDNYYDRGFDFLKQSKYDEAITVFQQQIRDYPQGDLADDAHYWVAEAMFINRKPADAKPHLRAIIDTYPQSARLPDAMLKMAYIEQDLGNVIEARILLQEIVAQHPSSNAAIAAKNRLENLKAKN